MTGFGRGVAEQAGVRATVDVRTVNHRFLDLKLRGVPLAAPLEDAIGAKVRGAIERGAVAVSVALVAPSREGAVRIDPAAAEHAHRVLTDVAARLGLPGPDLALVLAQPGVVVAAERADDDAAVAQAVAGALDAALIQLDEMRRADGTALAAELSGRLDELVVARTQIAELAATLPQAVSKRLHERLRRLLDDTELDPARLAQEVAAIADRADVTEELVRLASHLDQVRALLLSGEAVGRRLDFLVQEIGRELNTIGSKSALAEISTLVVGAKAILERVREQVQNVE